ncbi:hypothetical protein FACS1894152_2270 [Bacilli bacterium]|nr:hypothetical protein FACS1894152_2270 [Bacilli bacterium]
MIVATDSEKLWFWNPVFQRFKEFTEVFECVNCQSYNNFKGDTEKVNYVKCHYGNSQSHVFGAKYRKQFLDNFRRYTEKVNYINYMENNTSHTQANGTQIKKSRR